MKGYIFPILILLAGLIISGSIFYTKNLSFLENSTENKQSKNYVNISPITEEDHILGNPNAKIIIVEYSDFECFYCASFHVTMNRIINEYGKRGQVAWVYRHFPLDKIHKNARYAAIVSECVPKLTGRKNDFWDFSNLVFDDFPNSLSPEMLNNIAFNFEINEEQLKACTNDPNINNQINKSVEEGMLIYENDSNFGTPYNFILTKSGKQIIISGAQSYGVLKQIIEQELAAQN